MIEIKTVKSEKELKDLFNVLSEIFYDDAVENDEHYYTMSERYEEMKEQYKKNKDFLMYVEKDNQIVAGLTGKSMDLEKKKITIGILAVKKEYRMNGLAKRLVEEFEKRCKKVLTTNLHHGNIIKLTARCGTTKNLDN